MSVFEQERHSEIVSGAAEAFVITSRMVSFTAGQLPHVNIFVLSVPDETDPKQDALARVARISDLSTIPIGRDAGIATPGPNGVEYLSASTINSYTTLETANDAAVAFQDRVNQLILDWVSFSTKFNAPDPTPAVYFLPRVDASQKTALINAYAAAKQSRYQLGLTKTESEAALSRAQADYTYKNNLLANTSAILAGATSTSANLTTLITEFGVLLAAGYSFYTANTSGTGAVTFLNALSIGTAQQVNFAPFAVTAAALVTNSTNYNSSRASDAATASTALTAAQLAQITASQTFTSAIALEASTLAAVIAICPDFDLHSIPLVPG